MIADISSLQEIYTVSQLNGEVRTLLENSYPYIWVQGEISNFKRPGSGHVYFSLKDERAQINCAMFRMRNNGLKFTPRDGLQVLVQARVSLYEDRGSYQLIVEHMEEAGDGALQRAFEELKKRLSAQGLFDPAHKKPLPAYPTCVGIITSPTGAAIRDILNVLKRRAPHIPVIIYPTQVQGADAAKQIVAALTKAEQHNACDVLILARGGGSLEDLWPFNEEKVAYAIFACPIPIVSGVGHEIDFTIADFTADLRAPTPSAAAELISPDCSEHLRKLQTLEARFKHLISIEIRHFYTVLTSLRHRLQHPNRRLQDYAQRLDQLEHNLLTAQLNLIKHKQAELNHLYAKLQRHEPYQYLQTLALQQKNIQQRLITAMQYELTQKRQQLANVSRALDAVSPLNTLQRGYAIVTHDNKILFSREAVKNGDIIETRLANGKLKSKVVEV